jgi:hypothetical protein
MRGSGPRAEQISQIFKIYSRRYGLDREFPELSSDAFNPAAIDTQGHLFAQ